MPDYRADLVFTVAPSASGARDALLERALGQITSSLGEGLGAQPQPVAPTWVRAVEGSRSCTVSLALSGPATNDPTANGVLKAAVQKAAAGVSGKLSDGEPAAIAANCLRVITVKRPRERQIVVSRAAKARQAANVKRLGR